MWKITHKLVGDENAYLSMLFGIFHSKQIFLVFKPIFCHETVSLHVLTLEEVVLVSDLESMFTKEYEV